MGKLKDHMRINSSAFSDMRYSRLCYFGRPLPATSRPCNSHHAGLPRHRQLACLRLFRYFIILLSLHPRCNGTHLQETPSICFFPYAILCNGDATPTVSKY
ncbi:hypothetical protein E2C01_022611 [Portunus trituberculatus]|uniref:Uncharacterized protein n=1 Tax=Portunus trituberculatus TaxID=210409 RepID=A0A5B7E5U9_PORTR|nr:hypothetical protein [Portunus trituberculatus]